MAKINIRESLGRLDLETDNIYDLRNHYDSSKLSDLTKNRLAEAFNNNAPASKINRILNENFAINVFSRDSEEYEKLEKVADYLTNYSPNNIYYRVEKTYFDFGQDWMWTTIIAYDKKGNSWQAIYPKVQEDILLTDSDEELEEIAKKFLRESRLDKGFSEAYEPEDDRTEEEIYQNWLDAGAVPNYDEEPPFESLKEAISDGWEFVKYDGVGPVESDAYYKYIRDDIQLVIYPPQTFAGNIYDTWEAEIYTDNGSSYQSIDDTRDGFDSFEEAESWINSKLNNLGESLTEASYGGAYDIEDDMYFTKEELMDLAYEVCDYLQSQFGDMFEVENLYMDGPNTLYLSIYDAKYEISLDSNFRIDMRKIRKPSDLIRVYKPIISEYFKRKFDEERYIYTVDESLTGEVEEEQLYKIVCKSGASEWPFESALSYEDAEELVDYYNGRWIDEKGFEWSMEIEEDDESTERVYPFDESLNEKLIPAPQEVVDELLSILDSFGFVLDDSLSHPIGKTWSGNTHIQVINKDSHIEETEEPDTYAERLMEYVPDEMENEIDALSDREKVRITYNFGVNRDWQVTGGLDVWEKHVPGKQDESLDKDVLEYDDEMSDTWAGLFDVASPQEVADNFRKDVKSKDKIYKPNKNESLNEAYGYLYDEPFLKTFDDFVSKVSGLKADELDDEVWNEYFHEYQVYNEKYKVKDFENKLRKSLEEKELEVISIEPSETATLVTVKFDGVEKKFRFRFRLFDVNEETEEYYIHYIVSMISGYFTKDESLQEGFEDYLYRHGVQPEDIQDDQDYDVYWNKFYNDLELEREKEENLKESIDISDYEELHYPLRDGDKYYQLYRKIENGKGVWAAAELDKYGSDVVGEPFKITYEQARGFEPIEDSSIRRLSRDLGKKLLPKRENLDEQINLPGYAVKYITGYAGNGVNNSETEWFRTEEERDRRVKELKDKNYIDIKTWKMDNFYHTLPKNESLIEGIEDLDYISSTKAKDMSDADFKVLKPLVDEYLKDRKALGNWPDSVDERNFVKKWYKLADKCKEIAKNGLQGITGYGRLNDFIKIKILELARSVDNTFLWYVRNQLEKFGELSESLNESMDLSDVEEIKEIKFKNNRVNNLRGIFSTKLLIDALNEVGLNKFKIRTSRLKNVSQGDIKDAWYDLKKSGWTVSIERDDSLNGFNEVYVFEKVKNESLKEKLNNREKNVFINEIEKTESLAEIENIIKDIRAYDLKLYSKLVHYPNDFEKAKNYILKILKNSMLKEDFDDEVDLDYETDFDDDGVEEGTNFIEDGTEWVWVERIAGPIHLDFDNWAVWSAREYVDPREFMTIHDNGKGYDFDGDAFKKKAMAAPVNYFVVDEDTGFIDWGPVESQTEAQDFLNSKVEDWEKDESLNESEELKEDYWYTLHYEDIGGGKEYDYEVTYDELYNCLLELAFEEDDAPEDTKDYMDWVENNFDRLYDKYEDSILDYFEEDASQKEYDERDPDDKYDPYADRGVSPRDFY